MDREIDIIHDALKAAPSHPELTWGTPNARSKSKASDERTDADLPVTYCGKTSIFSVQVKRYLHSAVIERMVALHKTIPPSHPLMLIANHVTTQQAEALKQHGIAFLDAAGNACLDLPGLHLFIAGKGKASTMETSDPSRIFHRAGIQVIFAFLTDPALDQDPRVSLLNRTFREIRTHTGVALGSIGAILGSLEELEYVVKDRNLRFLTHRRRLFEKWVSAYVDRLRPKLLTRRYRSKGGDWWGSLLSPGAGNYWGGEVAAAKLTGQLKPERVTLYSRGETQALVLDADLRLDPMGDVEMMRVFWGDWPHGVRENYVHPLVVYADLMASEIDRNMETAKRVYDCYLRGIIEPRG